MELESELREQRNSSTAFKEQYTDWNAELQKKLRDFREEKKSWILESAALRTAEKGAKVC